MAVKPIVKTFEYFLDRLLKGFKKDQGREPNNLEMILIRQEAGGKARDANKVIQFPYKKSFGEEIDDLIKSGDVKIGEVTKKNDNVIRREMFQNSNLNKDKSIIGQINERMDNINNASKRLDEIMKEREEMFRPKTDAEIKAKLEKQNKEAAERMKKKKEDDPEFYTGGMVDVEPNLSDIGHGADALMARTRLLSPNNQATTSTGLNYLLAEDNDNLRVPFANGNGVADEDAENAKFAKRVRELMDEGFDMGEAVREAMKEGYAEGGRIGFAKGKIAKEVLDKGRRGFMKAAGAGAAGLAALKTGLLGFGEKAAPVVEKVAETVSQTAQSVPPYFFRLVEKIRQMGDETMASQDKAIAKKYKDYVMEEDFAGNIEIIKKGEDLAGNKLEDVYMKYTVDEVPLRSKKGSAKVEEYEEFTARPDMEGKMKDVEPGVPDEVIEEAGDIDAMTLKKADGGRIGFSKGKAVLGFLEIVKDPKKIREAVDNIFKTGDYKMDAELAAESLVELNPKAFGNKLFDDLDDKTRMEVYSAVLKDVMGDLGKTIKEKKTSTFKFLEKVFGKENMAEMPNRDPEMYKGMMEVVPMFRKKDKEGLKMYMQKYLPHMDDAQVEDFIVGDAEDMAGLGKFGLGNLQGQLIRLGSGRDYKNKIEAIKKLENAQKLNTLEVTDEMIRKPNAAGGLAKMLGE